MTALASTSSFSLFIAMTILFAALMAAHLFLGDKATIFGAIVSRVGGDYFLYYVIAAFFYFGSWAQTAAYLPFYICVISRRRRRYIWVIATIVAFSAIAAVIASTLFVTKDEETWQVSLRYMPDLLLEYAVQFGICVISETVVVDLVRYLRT